MIPFSDVTISVLGGAGKAGRPLVEEALTAGYRVRLLLRHPDRFNLTHDRLTVLSGDARNVNCLRELLGGSAALLSTLGNPNDEGVPIISTVTEHILTVMREQGLRRYVTVTSLYETDQVHTHEPTRQAAEYMNERFPQFMADRRREYERLVSSELDWTYVRLPYLVQEPPTGRVATNLQHLPGPRITAVDLARFLIGQLSDRRSIRQAPFVANG